MESSLNFISKGLPLHLNKKLLEKAVPQILIQGKINANLLKTFVPEMNNYMKEKIASNDAVIIFDQSSGPLAIVRLFKDRPRKADINKGSHYSCARDLLAKALGFMSSREVKNLNIIFDQLSLEQERGSLVGLEIFRYSFKKSIELKPLLEKVYVSRTKGKISGVEKSLFLGSAVNLARHLVNLPPNKLNPKTYSNFVLKHFGKEKNFKVEVWGEARLKKENMNLLLAVGKAAEHPPVLVHIRYRGASSRQSPVAIVGKGIIFDSGGLNLKPGSSMRIMKKDMGGSASVLGFAHWVKMTKPKKNFDFYLAIAENAVGGSSFRPGDVYCSRNGKKVEIDNTDAEGRLVLADAIDVAVSQKGSYKPSLLIDLATLTGATRIALGVDIAGLYCNNSKLCGKLMESSLETKDMAWPLPLYDQYFESAKSSVADFSNSTTSYFGGGIFAALFLKEFVGEDIPWAHFDFNAWTDKAQGAFSEQGGTGQVIQCLAHYFS